MGCFRKKKLFSHRNLNLHGFTISCHCVNMRALFVLKNYIINTVCIDFAYVAQEAAIERKFSLWKFARQFLGNFVQLFYSFSQKLGIRVLTSLGMRLRFVRY